MRKRDLDSVLGDFKSDLKSLKTFYKKAHTGLEAQDEGKSQHGTLCELVFHSAYVAFETYVSSLFVAYINKDASAFSAAQEKRILSLVEQEVGVWHKDRTKFSPEPHIPMERVEELIDPNGYNLTFKSASEMKKRAKKWLAPNHASGFDALTESDLAFLDAARSVRNCLAHQSKSSFERMNECLGSKELTGQYAVFRRGQYLKSDIGAYLKSDVDGKSRLLAYLETIESVSKGLKGV
ncbi:MAG: hypothetical protein FD161_3751 [Limisphaerales bacterium]|nr:MAG: hypothetical protein FD161_3751 [Limisphaerales bacterium]KAG0507496.1 MAG: hypothetical protein E1N63_3348 [Limisphaerales bacterium]TXT50705.1 MAG: hypothetical protein FD140_2177 [Limisphaerales bacterium]